MASKNTSPGGTARPEFTAVSSETSDEAQHTSQVGTKDISLLGNAPVEQQRDVIGFTDEGAVVERQLDVPREDLLLLSAIHPSSEPEHSIAKYLERFVRVSKSSLKFSSEYSIGQDFETVNIMAHLRIWPAFAQAREKLQGFYGIHMDAVLKVVVNAQAFQSGVFMVYYIPYGETDMMLPTHSDVESPLSLPFQTGCQNVLCNIATQSSVELRVSFTGPTAFINLTNDSSEFGRFAITTISPLRSGTNADYAPMQVYLAFENIKLFGATCQTFQAQMENANLSKQQMVPSQESKLSGSAGNLLSSILTKLGLSKPRADERLTRIRDDAVGFKAVCDSDSPAIPLSLLKDQQVKVGQLGIDSQDECDLLKIIEQPCYFDNFTWKVSQDTGTILWSNRVEPQGAVLGKITAQGKDNQVIAQTRLRYVAGVFNYWTGTMVYTFVVAATKFHSGRLRVQFVLGGPRNGTAPREEQLGYVYSHIIDLRDGNTFRVEVPYVSSAPWRHVPQYYSTSKGQFVHEDERVVNDWTARLVDHPNMIHVTVETMLRCSDTVDQSVNITVFESAGADFKFAGPRAPIRQPLQRIAFDSIKPDVKKMQPQSPIPDKTINMTNLVSSSPVSDATPYTFGEHITNVRQLIRRAHQMGSFDSGSDIMAIYPWMIPSLYLGLPYNKSRDFLSYFTPLYRFFRGSMRFSFVPISQDTQMSAYFDPHGNTFAEFMTYQSWGTDANYGVALMKAKLTSGNKIDHVNSIVSASTIAHAATMTSVEVDVPYYHRFHKSLCNSYPFSYDRVTAREESPPGILFVSTRNKDTTSNDTFIMYRAAGDDYNFGGLIGAPLVLLDLELP